ncbi:MAG TPA: hypothetical protein PKE12_15410, partial [Kiritimatiellia bacterium]|nr:hypothetical protein [Kiritimatiellia bacterium]
AEGEAAYRKALALDGTQRDALNGLAWHLATQPGLEPERRLEAVDLARRACQLSESRRAEFLDTLAAAHAAAGQFDEARRAGREALALARAQGPAGLATDIQRRLALYEQDLAFIDAIPD